MKVLHLCPNYPEEFRGGVERFVETLCPALRAGGVDCAVAAGSDRRAPGGAMLRQRHAGIDVFRLCRDPHDEHSVDLRHPSLAGPLAAALEACRPDVVHVHHWLNLGVGIVGAARARGVPAVVTLHDAWITCARFNRVVDDRFCERAQSVEQCAPCLLPVYPGDAGALRTEVAARAPALLAELRCASRVLVPSVAARQLVARFCPDLDPPEVVGNGVPDLPAAPGRPGLPAGRPARIGCLGSVVREKGVHLLLAAACELQRERPVEMHVHGHLPDADYAESLRRADRAGVMTLHGSYEPADLAGIAAGLHVAVFPSICSESWSLALDEALALRLPVVVAERGALAERIGGAGVTFAPEDARALAGALRAVLADPARLARMAGCSRDMRGMDAVARDLLRVYDAASGRPGSRWL